MNKRPKRTRENKSPKKKGDKSSKRKGKINFCQENISESKFGVLRGLHFQKHPFAQSKLINVQKGKILDVCVDLRKNSKFYGKHYSIFLDDIENKSLFIPKGFAHGFIVLSKSARVAQSPVLCHNESSQAATLAIRPVSQSTI